MMSRGVLPYIEPDHEYTCVEMRNIPSNMIEWLQENMPDKHRWLMHKNEIIFHNKSDHLMFLLRWS